GALLRDFLAYNPAFSGGVRVAAGDINGTGLADIITGSGPGAPPEVRAFNPNGAMIEDYYAFTPTFAGGIFVAAGDIDTDGRADVMVGLGAGGGPEVKVFDGSSTAALRDFHAYNSADGVHVAAVDLTGTHQAAVLTGA